MLWTGTQPGAADSKTSARHSRALLAGFSRALERAKRSGVDLTDKEATLTWLVEREFWDRKSAEAVYRRAFE